MSYNYKGKVYGERDCVSWKKNEYSSGKRFLFVDILKFGVRFLLGVFVKFRVNR